MPDEVAREAARRIAASSGVPRHDAVVVLGSGWTGAIREIGAPTWQVPVADLPGFVDPTAPGHAGLGGLRATAYRPWDGWRGSSCSAAAPTCTKGTALRSSRTG